METIQTDWITIAGIVGILAFLWKLSSDIGGLRERMARLEGAVDVLTKFLIDRERKHG